VEESQIVALNRQKVTSLANQGIHPLLKLAHVDAVQEGDAILADSRPPAIAREFGIPDMFFNDLRYPLEKGLPLLPVQSRKDGNSRSR
jgi:hypothetical protein